MSDNQTKITPLVKRAFIPRLAISLMRVFFKLLYHPFAWSYDWVASVVSAGRWKKWVLAAAGLVKGSRVLELGTGPGHAQEYFFQTGISTFGLDESRQMLRQAQRRLILSSYQPRLARARAQDLPFRSETFDSVIATFPTQYIYDPEALESIRRVLVPGGRLVVLMTAWVTGGSLLDRAVRWLNRITAQTLPEDQELIVLLEPYLKAGLEASLRFIEQPGSRLMIILAKKPVQPD